MASIWDRLFPQEDYRTTAPQGGYADLYAQGLLARNRGQAPRSVNAAQGVMDFLPVVGDVKALGEAYDAATRGELMAAGILGTGAAVGLIPGAGDAIAKPLMAAGRRAADVARRIEVDPNALGSMGGNIRLRPQAVGEADEITLFHGSPYDFRSFDASQIGKGEGAQDLGRGFSLTDEEVVAHSYMNPASRWGDLEAMERYRKAGPGRTYQVGLKARPEQILDWKKPWKDQVPEGTPIYDKIQESMAKSYADDPEMQKLFQQANLSSVWRDDFGMEDAALKSGFVGNKRQNFSGDTEFTVFDPSKMEIKKVFDNEGRELPIAPSSPAQEVAGLLSSGRVDEVTDKMLGKLTPNDEKELFDLYQRGATGMDLPMDEASRMARAGEIDAYHGTDRTFSAFDPTKFGEKDPGWYGRGVTTDTDPEVAAAYANYDEAEIGQQIIPVRIGGGRYMDWPEGQLPFGNPRDSAAGTKDMQSLGYVGSKMTNDRDLYGDVADIQTEYVTFDPSNVRSRFARFDPRLAHLRNLSAGVGGLGLLATMPTQEEQY